uniref:Uncharacterized protein n=1 Tax=Triticum urartu TaxID=4572 RepID=A0A8R7US82_TRIUA
KTRCVVHIIEVESRSTWHLTVKRVCIATHVKAFTYHIDHLPAYTERIARSKETKEKERNSCSVTCRFTRCR